MGGRPDGRLVASHLLHRLRAWPYTRESTFFRTCQKRGTKSMRDGFDAIQFCIVFAQIPKMQPGGWEASSNLRNPCAKAPTFFTNPKSALFVSYKIPTDSPRNRVAGARAMGASHAGPGSVPAKSAQRPRWPLSCPESEPARKLMSNFGIRAAGVPKKCVD